MWFSKFHSYCFTESNALYGGHSVALPTLISWMEQGTESSEIRQWKAYFYFSNKLYGLKTGFDLWFLWVEYVVSPSENDCVILRLFWGRLACDFERFLLIMFAWVRTVFLPVVLANGHRGLIDVTLCRNGLFTFCDIDWKGWNVT